MPILGILASAQIGANSNSYQSIATLSGTGSSGTISFTSIPSTYKHLQIRGIARESSGGGTSSTFLGLQFNGDTGSNYALHYLLGDGSSVSSSQGTSLTRAYSGVAAQNASGANLMGPTILDILDYQNTNKNKTVRLLSGNDRNGSGEIVFVSGLWTSTAAVNRVDVYSKDGQNFGTTTTFALYGIKG